MRQEEKALIKVSWADKCFQAEKWLVGSNQSSLAKAGGPMGWGLPLWLRSCQPVAPSFIHCEPQRASGKLRLLAS